MSTSPSLADLIADWLDVNLNLAITRYLSMGDIEWIKCLACDKWIVLVSDDHVRTRKESDTWNLPLYAADPNFFPRLSAYLSTHKCLQKEQ